MFILQESLYQNDDTMTHLSFFFERIFIVQIKEIKYVSILGFEVRQ